MKMDMRMVGLASIVLLVSIVTSLLGDLYFGGIIKTIGDFSCITAIILFVLAFIVPLLGNKKEDKIAEVANKEFENDKTPNK